jgi:hypothetical protein
MGREHVTLDNGETTLWIIAGAGTGELRRRRGWAGLTGEDVTPTARRNVDGGVTQQGGVGAAKSTRRMAMAVAARLWAAGAGREATTQHNTTGRRDGERAIGMGAWSGMRLLEASAARAIDASRDKVKRVHDLYLGVNSNGGGSVGLLRMRVGEGFFK